MKKCELGRALTDLGPSPQFSPFQVSHPQICNVSLFQICHVKLLFVSGLSAQLHCAARPFPFCTGRVEVMRTSTEQGTGSPSTLPTA